MISKNTLERTDGFFETVWVRVCQSVSYQPLLGLQQQVPAPHPGKAPAHTVSTAAGRDVLATWIWFPSVDGCWEDEKKAVGWQSLPKQLKERRGERSKNAFLCVCFSGI